MRKITKEAVNAFVNNRNYSNSNTMVCSENGEMKMYLHGNLIAETYNGKLFITNAGWKSNTTKERLNGLPNVSIYQKNYVWYLNSEQWDGKLKQVD